MDSSITRRGQPCWYRNEGVGFIAINDAFLLEAAIYWLLKKYFRADPSYVNLLELFHEVCPCPKPSCTAREPTYVTHLDQLSD